MAAATDSIIEIDFARGQNGSDLLLTLFKKVAAERNLILTDVAIHFIWDTTRLMECTSYVLPTVLNKDSKSVPTQEFSLVKKPEVVPWIALRVETQQVAEDDYICETRMKQVVFVQKRKKVCSPSQPAACAEEQKLRPGQRKKSSQNPYQPLLLPVVACSLLSVKRPVTRYLYEFYERWVPPNWSFIATQFKSPLLRMGPATCSPIDNPKERRLTNRLTARVRRSQK